MTGLDPQAVLVVDQTSQEIIGLAEKNRRRFDDEYELPVLEAREEFIPRIGSGLAGREAAEALESYMSELEMRLIPLAARRSRLFWLHMSRRLPPISLHGSKPWTTVLFRTVFKLALLKYGHGCVDAEFAREDDQFVTTDLDFEDVLALYQMLELACEQNFVASAFRRVGKGAVLLAKGAGGFDTPADEDLERRIKLLDRRVLRYQDTLSHSGSMTSAAPTTSTELNISDLLLPFPQMNVEQSDIPDPFLKLGGLGPMPFGKPNYLPGMVQMAGIRRVLLLFADDLRIATGADPDELIGVLFAFGRRQMSQIGSHPQAAIQFLQRGYMVTTSDEAYAAALSDVAEGYRTYASQVAKKDICPAAAWITVSRVLEQLTYTEDDLRQINLWDRAPHKLVVRAGEYAMWDMSSLPLILGASLATIGSYSGVTGEVKGKNFEEEVEELLRHQAELRVWRCREKLKAKNGEREIDASFIAGDVLWVVECKAYATNYRIERGDYAALKGRWRTLQKDLEQARTLARFIEENHSGQRWQLPPEVKRIEYCVCTPLAEHMQELGNAYWLSPDVPRVCLPRELVKFATASTVLST
jgi:Nuclease-related domain